MCSLRGTRVRRTRGIRRVMRGIIWWAVHRPQPIMVAQCGVMHVLRVVTLGRVVHVAVVQVRRVVISL